MIDIEDAAHQIFKTAYSAYPSDDDFVNSEQMKEVKTALIRAVELAQECIETCQMLDIAELKAPVFIEFGKQKQ